MDPTFEKSGYDHFEKPNPDSIKMPENGSGQNTLKCKGDNSLADLVKIMTSNLIFQ